MAVAWVEWAEWIINLKIIGRNASGQIEFDGVGIFANPFLVQSRRVGKETNS
jgi:hypothetical protein